MKSQTETKYLYIAPDATGLIDCISNNRNTKVVMWNVPTLTSKDIRSIARVISENDTLKEFYCAHSNLYVDFEPLAKSLRDNSSIEIVNLKYDDLRPNDVKHLANALQHNKKLKRVFLRNNLARVKGAKALANSLKVNRRLEQLNLSANEITDEGAIAIAKSLEENNVLRKLFLRENRLSNAVAVAFANALTKNVALEFLDLEANKIQDAGAIALSEAMLVNDCLTDLNLRENLVGEEGALKLISSYRKSAKFRYLHLFENPLGNNIKDMLDDAHREKGQTDKNNRLEFLDDFTEMLEYGDVGPWNRSKLMLVGQGRAGKSATVRSLLGERFLSTLDSTVGASVVHARSKQYGWDKTRLHNVTTDFLARTVYEKNKNRRKNRSKSIRIESLFENEDSENEGEEEELTEIEQITKKQMQMKSERERSPAYSNEHRRVLLKNSMDAIKVSKAIKEAEKHSFSLSFTLWDFGGQKVFYALHHLFLTNYGTYLLLFDMRMLLREPSSANEYLKFWLNSIRIHAPEAPVILLGSHLDKIKSKRKLRAVNKVIKPLLINFPTVALNTDANLHFFPISNKDGRGIELVRQTIEKKTKNQEFVSRMVPSRWMQCYDKLMKGERNWLLLEEVQNSASSVGINESSEVSLMLNFFHELGVILHISSTEALAKMVILNPQWLVDKISLVIRDSELHSFDNNVIAKVGLADDVRNLNEHGLLSRDLMEYLWHDGEESPITTTGFLVDLMKQTILMSDWNFGDDAQYLVSSLLPVGRKPKLINGNQCVFDFSGKGLPFGVFQRLVCTLVSYLGKMKETQAPTLEQSSFILNFSQPPSTLVLEQNDELIILTVSQKGRASLFYSVIASMLRKIDVETMSGRLEWEIRFKNGRKMISLTQAQKVKLSPWFDAEEGTVTNTHKKTSLDLDGFASLLE